MRTTSANTIARAGRRRHLAAKKMYMPGREKRPSELRAIVCNYAADGLACPGTDQTYLRATYGVNKNYANVHLWRRVGAHMHEHMQAQTQK